jgi:hypothetical protein
MERCRTTGTVVAYSGMTPSERYHRMTEIFLAVCSLGDCERKRSLDELCAEVPELRPEVELLLSFHDQLAAASGGKRTESN